MTPKNLIMSALFSRWPGRCPYEPGYTVLLPSPMDMPFLLRYALEGLRGVDLEHCRQILVIPDGWGDDGGAGLRGVVSAFDDPRIRMTTLRPVERAAIRLMGRANGSGTHWATIVNGTLNARADHVFLHDSDAFFLSADGLERQYRECRDRGLYTLGVTPRLDAFFETHGYTIPGTWEMMFSTRWARSRSPYALKGRVWPTPLGEYEFDTMLYPQFLDAPSGKVGVMADPPRLVHFNGTIVTYRVFRDRGGRQVVDELFRVLLLSLLEDLLPARSGGRSTPAVADLARGLDDPGAAVRYDTDGAARQYPAFRRQIDELCDSPTFRGDRAGRTLESLRPFDDHFAARADPGAPAPAFHRQHGLG